MSKENLGVMPSGASNWDSAFGTVRQLDAMPRSADETLGERRVAVRDDADQLARDIAEIERATIALRKVAPTLEAWTDRAAEGAAPVAVQPRSVWVLVGVLWLSTALVTAGALAAIAKLVG